MNVQRNLFALAAILTVTLSAGPKLQTIKGSYPAPARVDAQKIAKIPTSGVPKNIIFIIGDGMGQGALDLGSLYARGAKEMLVINQYPVTGLATTHSANNTVTDSAASGTALSSGYKTNNGMLGMTPDEKPFKSIAAAALESGRSIGIVTTDSLTGATPAAFLVNVKHRGMTDAIALQESKSKAHLLIGSKKEHFLPKAAKGSRKDGKNPLLDMTRDEYLEVNSPETLKTAPLDKKVFGFVRNWDQTVLLSRFAEAAMERLNRNPNGFFLMVEGHYPDKGGHNNAPEKSANGVLMVDFVAKTAMEFAMKHPDTLVVITADHETGGLSVSPNRKNAKCPYFCYTSRNHTGMPVRVFAFGAGAERFAGLLDNTDIPKTFAEFWNLKLKQPK